MLTKDPLGQVKFVVLGICVATAVGLFPPQALGYGQDCPNPAGGDCFTVTAAAGCQDETCCNLVCGPDPACCADPGDGWDSICVTTALANCDFDDCNNNGFPDDHDIADMTSEDCNSNLIPDECDLLSGLSKDCNRNLIPDECELTPDCNSDGIPDECQDCDDNGTADECEILVDPSLDCDNNGILDICQDCNANGVPDPTDIAPGGGSDDDNGNCVPDECEDAQLQVIALDCVESVWLGRDFAELRRIPDLNNARQIAFSDQNGVYRYDFLNDGPLVVAAERGDEGLRPPTCTCSGTMITCKYSQTTRINENGVVAWYGYNSSGYGSPGLTCADPVVCPSGPLIISPNVYRSIGGVIQLLVCGPGPEGYDLELLEDDRVVFEFGDPLCDPANPSGLMISDFTTVEVAALWGGSAPEGGTYGCTGDTFGGFSSGEDTPAMFHAKIDDTSCEFKLINNRTTPSAIDCTDPLDPPGAPYVVPDWVTKPDLGCVTGCELLDQHGVIFADVSDDTCEAGDDSLIEINLVSEHMTLLIQEGDTIPGVTPAEVLCDLLPDFGPDPPFEDNAYGPSASLFEPLGPDCEVGRAVFAGHYDGTVNCNTSTDTAAIFLVEAANDISVLVKEGDTLPFPYDTGANEREFVAFGPPVINANGEIVFWAESDILAGGDLRGGIFLYNLRLECSAITVLPATPGKLNTTAGSDSGTDARAQVTTDGSGKWIAVWDSDDTTGGYGSDHDILFASSTNAGSTWTAPKAFNSNAKTDSTYDDKSAQLATDGAGVWVGVWQSDNPLGFASIGTDLDILVSRSTNGGVTWSSPKALESNASSDTGADIAPQIATDEAGNWIVVWESTDPVGGIGTDRDILFSRSTDNGVTWSTAAKLNSRADVDGSASDTAAELTTDGLGNWVTVWSSFDDLGGSIGTDSDILVSRYTDVGGVWSAQAALTGSAATDGTATDTRPDVTTNESGMWITAWRSTNDFNSTIGTDTDILYARSTTMGQTWTGPHTLNSNAATDSTHADDYVQITTDGACNWVAVWRSDNDLGSTIGTDFDILYARSCDLGSSWTAPEELHDNADTDSDTDHRPQVTTDELGNWVGVWESDEDLGGIGSDYDIFRVVFDIDTCCDE